MGSKDKIWLSIYDYAKYNDISISTVRRQIKSKTIKYKLQNRKYFICISSFEERKNDDSLKYLQLSLLNEELKFKLRKLEEENNELKMLVKIYEQKEHLIGQDVSEDYPGKNVLQNKKIVNLDTPPKVPVK